MSNEVLLSVPAEFAAQVIAQANGKGNSVAVTLQNWIELFNQQSSPAMNEWPDEQVLEAADVKLPAKDSERMSELIQAQQAREVSAAEAAELRNLVTCYQALQLFQARALGEAIRRGLRSVPVIGS